MGKNKIIKILGNILGNVIVHKILVRYTNKPESVHYIAEEIGTYRENALEIAQEFNWNMEDKDKIKQETLRNFKKRIKKYKDVKFPISDATKLIDETIKELLFQ